MHTVKIDLIIKILIIITYLKLQLIKSQNTAQKL